MTKLITVPNVYENPHEELFDGRLYIPKEIGDLKLLRRESLTQDSRPQITYYDWDLSFKNTTIASRTDNFGRDEIQLIFNMNQNIEWKIGDEQNNSDGEYEIVKMSPGQVCVFRNNDYKTSMQYDDSVNFKFKSLQMKTSYFEGLLTRYFPKEEIELCKNVFLTHVTKTQITPQMYKVLAQIDDSEKYHQFKGIYVEAKMIELIALVLNSIFYDKVKISPRKNIGATTTTYTITSNTSESDISKIESLYHRISFNPSDSYSIPELAKNLSMSESKLTRLFRSLYGTSIHQYVQNQRLEKAAILIATKGLNVSEAALQSGYTNMSWFSKEFQKKFGITPKKYSKEKAGFCN